MIRRVRFERGKTMNDIWYNYITGESTTQEPDTDELARQLIPQNPSAQTLYNLYRQHGGLSIREAMFNILLSCVGEPARYPVTDWK